MSNAAEDFLNGGGGIPSAFGKDDQIGTSITGTICETPEVRQQTDLATGEPLFWNDGKPRNQLLVTLQTSARDDADDDGRRRIYVKGSQKAGSKSLHDAVASAVRNSGAKGLAVGGTLKVVFVGTEPSATRGFNDRKLFEASYIPPDATAATGSFLGTDTDPAPAAPAAPTATPPAAPIDRGSAVATAKELLAAEVSIEEIAKATGLAMTTVAALKNIA